VKSLIRLAMLLSALSFASPITAATVVYSFQAAGGVNNPDGRLEGRLSFDLDGAQLFGNNQFITRHSKIAQLDAIITGGTQVGLAVNLSDVTVFSMYSYLSNAIFAGSGQASLVLNRWNAPFMAAEDLTVMSFETGRIWVKPDQAGLNSVESYSLTSLAIPEVFTVPLPSSFPMLLGACLATAFVGRRRRKRR
jgi:hypothetical protein